MEASHAPRRSVHKRRRRKNESKNDVNGNTKEKKTRRHHDRSAREKKRRSKPRKAQNDAMFDSLTAMDDKLTELYRDSIRVDEVELEVVRAHGDRWFEMSGAERLMQSSETSYSQYVTLSKRSDDFQRTRDQIAKDVLAGRSDAANFHPTVSAVVVPLQKDQFGPQYVQKGREQLNRLLISYVFRNHSTGYVQGMNYIAALLLAVLDEERAFWVLVTLVAEVRLPDYYSDSLAPMNGLNLSCVVLRHLALQECPSLVSTLQGTDNFSLFIQVLAAKLLIPVFVNRLPLDSTIVVWDEIFDSRRRITESHGLHHNEEDTDNLVQYAGEIALFRVMLGLFHLVAEEAEHTIEELDEQMGLVHYTEAVMRICASIEPAQLRAAMDSVSPTILDPGKVHTLFSALRVSQATEYPIARHFRRELIQQGPFSRRECNAFARAYQQTYLIAPSHIRASMALFSDEEEDERRQAAFAKAKEAKAAEEVAEPIHAQDATADIRSLVEVFDPISSSSDSEDSDGMKHHGHDEIFLSSNNEIGLLMAVSDHDSSHSSQSDASAKDEKPTQLSESSSSSSDGGFDYDMVVQEALGQSGDIKEGRVAAPGITYGEFRFIMTHATAVRRRLVWSPALIRAAFEGGDEDRDGHLDFKDVAPIVATATVGSVEQFARLIFRCLDTAHRGLLGKNELAVLLCVLRDTLLHVRFRGQATKLAMERQEKALAVRREQVAEARRLQEEAGEDLDLVDCGDDDEAVEEPLILVLERGMCSDEEWTDFFDVAVPDDVAIARAEAMVTSWEEHHHDAAWLRSYWDRHSTVLLERGSESSAMNDGEDEREDSSARRAAAEQRNQRKKKRAVRESSFLSSEALLSNVTFKVAQTTLTNAVRGLLTKRATVLSKWLSFPEFLSGIRDDPLLLALFDVPAPETSDDDMRDLASVMRVAHATKQDLKGSKVDAKLITQGAYETVSNLYRDMQSAIRSPEFKSPQQQVVLHAMLEETTADEQGQLSPINNDTSAQGKTCNEDINAAKPRPKACAPGCSVN